MCRVSDRFNFLTCSRKDRTVQWKIHKGLDLFKTSHVSSKHLLWTFCRAAMKMANMDAVVDFMFTNPKDAQGVRIIFQFIFFCNFKCS